MAIAVTNTYKDASQLAQEHSLPLAKLAITGLTAGAANTIPHGLPRTPYMVLWVAASGTPGFETQAADATNIYITTGALQTSATAYCFF